MRTFEEFILFEDTYTIGLQNNFKPTVIPNGSLPPISSNQTLDNGRHQGQELICQQEKLPRIQKFNQWKRKKRAKRKGHELPPEN